MLHLAAILSAVGLLAGGAPSAKLVHKAGKLGAGAKVLVQVEVTWEGRPETHLVGTPSVDPPKGGAVRLGRTTSSFDGTHTTWLADVVLELPEKGSRWTVGPATVPLKAGPLAGKELKAPKLSLGGASNRRRALVAQGIGNGVVVVAVLAYVVWRWRSLAPVEETA